MFEEFVLKDDSQYYRNTVKLHCPFCWKYTDMIKMSDDVKKDLFKCTACDTVFNLEYVLQERRKYREFQI